jgi:Flp pilus assembly protein TadG
VIARVVLRGLPNSARGSAVVEFALVVPLILVLVMGIAEVAVVARTELQLVSAAREGARQSATSPDTGLAVAAARNALGGAGANARVSVSRPAAIGEPTTVTVRLRHRVATPIFGGFPIDLSASISMRTER